MKKLLFLFAILLIHVISFAQIDPRNFGAKADGVSDDTDALYRSIAHCMSYPQYKTPELWLYAGVYRITRPLVIGGYAVKPADCFVNNLATRYNGTSKFNYSEYMKGCYSAAIKIKGIGTVSIYADFNDSTELSPAIVYQAAGDGRIATSTCQLTAEISNIGIYAKGTFDAQGRPLARPVPPYKTNNQVGLLALYTNGLRLYDVSFKGFKEGIIINNCCFLDVRNLKVEYCQRALFEIQSATSQYSNVAVYFCDKGFELRSNQLKVDTYYAHTCGVGLHVAASNNKFLSVYLESLKTTEGQLVIGDNPGDPIVSPLLIRGVDFDMLTMVAMKSPVEPGNGIVWKDNARRMTINGGEIQSCTFVYPSHLLTKTYYEGLTGNLPAAVSIKLD